MHETPLASSSPIRSKIKQITGRQKAKNSRRSVSLLDVSAIDTNPDVSSQISESNETLASGYRDSGYVRSEASSLEEDDSKASKDLFEELKFKDVLICELQESNRGLRMRCADAENKIWRLRVKCQSHCACCQAKEIAASPTDSASEDKDGSLSTTNGKYELLSHDLFQFKGTHPLAASSNDLSLSFGNDRLTNARGRLANSFSAQDNTSQTAPSKKPLSRSKSSGTIGTQTPAHRSSRRNDDQEAEKLFALKVRQWQEEHALKRSPTDESSIARNTASSSEAADLSSKPLHPQSRSTHTRLPHRTSKYDRGLDHFEMAEGEASLLSVISERDSSLEVDPRRLLNSGSHSPDISTDYLLSNSTPFADITNQRTSAYGVKHQVPKALNAQQHSIASPYIFHPGFDVDGRSKTPKDHRPADIDWANSMLPESVSGPPPGVSEPFAKNRERFAAHEQPCANCKCAQPSPVIIVPTGCCSCCKMADNQLTSTPFDTHQHLCEASPRTPKNRDHSQLKLDASTDSSDLHPMFEKKSKTSSAAGKFNFPVRSEFESKAENETVCRSPSSDRDLKCSPNCSGSNIPFATRFDAKTEYKRKIEEGMKKFALDARAETESLSFQPWTSPDSPEMSPLMKRLAESSHYVNQMAIAINRIATRFQHVTGTTNPVNPSP